MKIFIPLAVILQLAAGGYVSYPAGVAYINQPTNGHLITDSSPVAYSAPISYAAPIDVHHQPIPSVVYAVPAQQHERTYHGVHAQRLVSPTPDIVYAEPSRNAQSSQRAYYQPNQARLQQQTAAEPNHRQPNTHQAKYAQQDADQQQQISSQNQGSNNQNRQTARFTNNVSPYKYSTTVEHGPESYHHIVVSHSKNANYVQVNQTNNDKQGTQQTARLASQPIKYRGNQHFQDGQTQPQKLQRTVQITESSPEQHEVHVVQTPVRTSVHVTPAPARYSQASTVSANNNAPIARYSQSHSSSSSSSHERQGLFEVVPLRNPPSQNAHTQKYTQDQQYSNQQSSHNDQRVNHQPSQNTQHHSQVSPQRYRDDQQFLRSQNTQGVNHQNDQHRHTDEQHSSRQQHSHNVQGVNHQNGQHLNQQSPQRYTDEQQSSRHHSSNNVQKVSQRYQYVGPASQKSQKYQVRTPAIHNQFYDIEERVIVRPVGSALVEFPSHSGPDCNHPGGVGFSNDGFVPQPSLQGFEEFESGQPQYQPQPNYVINHGPQYFQPQLPPQYFGAAPPPFAVSPTPPPFIFSPSTPAPPTHPIFITTTPQHPSSPSSPFGPLAPSHPTISPPIFVTTPAPPRPTTPAPGSFENNGETEDDTVVIEARRRYGNRVYPKRKNCDDENESNEESGDRKKYDDKEGDDVTTTKRPVYRPTTQKPVEQDQSFNKGYGGHSASDSGSSNNKDISNSGSSSNGETAADDDSHVVISISRTKINENEDKSEGSGKPIYENENGKNSGDESKKNNENHNGNKKNGGKDNKTVKENEYGNNSGKDNENSYGKNNKKDNRLGNKSGYDSGEENENHNGNNYGTENKYDNNSGKKNESENNYSRNNKKDNKFGNESGNSSGKESGKQNGSNYGNNNENSYDNKKNESKNRENEKEHDFGNNNGNGYESGRNNGSGEKPANDNSNGNGYQNQNKNGNENKYDSSNNNRNNVNAYENNGNDRIDVRTSGNNFGNNDNSQPKTSYGDDQETHNEPESYDQTNANGEGHVSNEYLPSHAHEQDDFLHERRDMNEATEHPEEHTKPPQSGAYVNQNSRSGKYQTQSQYSYNSPRPFSAQYQTSQQQSYRRPQQPQYEERREIAYRVSPENKQFSAQYSNQQQKPTGSYQSKPVTGHYIQQEQPIYYRSSQNQQYRQPQQQYHHQQQQQQQQHQYPQQQQFQRQQQQPQSEHLPLVITRGSPSVKESEENQQNLFKLLTQRENIAQVGYAQSGRSNANAQLVDAGVVRGRVISVTPAPLNAAPTEERVNTRRIVVSRPIETIHEADAPDSGDLQSYQQSHNNQAYAQKLTAQRS